MTILINVKIFDFDDSLELGYELAPGLIFSSNVVNKRYNYMQGVREAVLQRSTSMIFPTYLDNLI